MLYSGQERKIAMAGIRIARLVYKGDADAPQLLLVIGTTDRPGDLWVRIGDRPLAADAIDAGADRLAAAWPGTITELARVLGAVPGDGAAPAPDTAQSLNPCTDYYGVACEPGEALWVARFYVDEHRRSVVDGEPVEDLQTLWQQGRGTADGDADAAPPLHLAAWTTEPLPDWREADDDPPLRRTGDPALATVRVADAVQGYLFDLGILLVHGIGPHKVRQTLIKFGEPLVAFWQRWLGEVTHRAATALDPARRKRFRARAEHGALRNSDDNEGLSRQLEWFAGGAGDAAVTSTGHVAGVFCGAVRAEDTDLSGADAGMPTSTLIRQSLVGDDARVREQHVLLAEAWWTRETVEPTQGELSDWILRAFPIVLQMHVNGILEHSLDDLRNSGWRRLPNLLILLHRVLVLLPLEIVLAALAQAGLFVLLLLSALPVDWIRRTVRRLVMDVLLQTVGQSHALMNSLVRRNGIVRSVARDLDWLSARCDNVVVISHSQGAEISRLVFEARRRPNVRKWITLGAGIRPLNLLARDPLGRMPWERSTRGFAHLLNLAAGLVLALVAVVALRGFLAADAPWPSPLPAAARDTLLLALGIVGVALWSVGLQKGLVRVNPLLRLRPSVMRHWDDYAASLDPVSAGSLMSGYEIPDHVTPPREHVIHNARSVLRDHTGYFRNLEQFVAPVALELFALAGDASTRNAREVCSRFYGAGPGPGRIEAALTDASARRERLTWWRMVTRYVGLYGFAALVIHTAVGPDDRGTAWRALATEAWRESDALWPSLAALWSSGLVSSVIGDLGPGLLVLTFYAVLRSVVIARASRRSAERLYSDLAGALDTGAGNPRP